MVVTAPSELSRLMSEVGLVSLDQSSAKRLEEVASSVMRDFGSGVVVVAEWTLRTTASRRS
jgi:hypothetical protein